MDSWLIENREWLSVAAPCNAVILAFIFWLLVSRNQTKAEQLSEAVQPSVLTFAAAKREDFKVAKEEIVKFRAKRRTLLGFNPK